ncbi:MAG: serine/threonine protein kinase [Deltaproteobacteria bacterium]|nr:serine/threonine protein kinase [Deltaproteobacteria bacterium]
MLMDPQVGQLINNKYRLVRLIGDGGMGSVFEARHELLGTTVALKFLHPALTRRKGLVERFLQEAQVSARIDNPHVVRVSDVDRTYEGLAFMVMEYVVGETLQMLYERNYQEGTRMPYADAFDYMLQLLDGVGSAHKLAIVHRDLKPDNVMLSGDGDGKTLVKILDFGIAKLKASGEVDRGLTRPGVVMGTPEYMAPEQAFSADKVDARADIFSLGVMFFEMLAGRRPVGGDNAHAIAAQYLEGGIAQLTDLAPALDPDLAAAVHKSMSAKPDDRFETMAQFRNAVIEFAPEGGGARGSGDVGLADTQDESSASDVAAAAVAAVGAAGAAADGDTPNVPQTVPPEDGAATTADDADGEAAGDQAGYGNDGAMAGDAAAAITPDGSDSAVETRADPNVAPALTGDEAGEPIAAEGYETPAGEGLTPLRAGTEKMPDDALAGIARSGTEAIAAHPNDEGAAAAPVGAERAGGTVVGDPFGGAGAAPEPVAQPPHDGGYGQGQPMVPHGAVGTTPATAPVAREQRAKSGPSFLSILLLAGIVSGAVVGGVYVAHRASQEEDADDPYPVTTQAAPPETPADPPIADPPPVEPPIGPPPVEPPPTVTNKPPPPKPTTKPTAKPTAKPSATNPWILPSSLPPPPVIPSGFPPLFKLPGNNNSPPQPPPATGQPTQPKPKPTVQPKPKPATPPKLKPLPPKLKPKKPVKVRPKLKKLKPLPPKLKPKKPVKVRPKLKNL